MSIERDGGTYTPVCDYCGDELLESWDFDDAVVSKKQAGWRSVKEDDGWSDYCPECYSDRNNAASDFAGVTP